MNKKRMLLAVAALALPLISGAQVKVIEDEYMPTKPAKPIAAPKPGVAVMAQESVDTGLPIESADVAVARAHPYRIKKGVAIHSQLEAWARAQGWELIWYPSISWRAIADADFNQHKEITAAIEDVVNILRDEGKPIRLRISEGNRVLEVTTNEVRGEL